MSTVTAKVGETANSYQVLSKLGAGGMAEIFLARGATSTGVERYCALKRILPERAHDVRFTRMFVEEARLALLLQHPNIASGYDIGVLDDLHFYTMEYVHGETVRSLALRAHDLHRTIPLACVLTVIAGAAAGLHHAHERNANDGRPLGIVHRDVSPSNLMVSYEGNVKLVDFGVAKTFDRAVETTSGAVKGKITYLSPEQCRGRTVDRRSDLFSLGIVMWEMLTGERLYRRASDFESMAAIVEEAPVPPSTRRHEIPAAVDAIVSRLLAKSPQDRFQTAAEVVEAIENASIRTGTALSAGAVGRLVHDLFGPRAEPWLASERALADSVTLVAHPIAAASAAPRMGAGGREPGDEPARDAGGAGTGGTSTQVVALRGVLAGPGDPAAEAPATATLSVEVSVSGSGAPACNEMARCVPGAALASPPAASGFVPADGQPPALASEPPPAPPPSLVARPMRAGAWPAYSEAQDPSATSAGSLSPPSAAGPHEAAHAWSNLSTAGAPMRHASQNGDDAGPLAATPRRAAVRAVLLVVTVMCVAILVAVVGARRSAPSPTRHVQLNLEPQGAEVEVAKPVAPAEQVPTAPRTGGDRSTREVQPPPLRDGDAGRGSAEVPIAAPAAPDRGAQPPASLRPATPPLAAAHERRRPAALGVTVDGEPAPDPAAQPPASLQPATPPPAAAQERRRPDAVAVVIHSEPAGAQILLDGRVLGVTPFRGTLPRRDDDVVLVIRKAGYVEKAVVAHTSRSLGEHVVLVRRPAPSCRTDPDCSVNPF